MNTKEIEFNLALFIGLRIKNYSPDVQIYYDTLNIYFNPLKRKFPAIRVSLKPKFEINEENYPNLTECVDAALATIFSTRVY